MTDKTYNGWTNYETWRVNLEIFDGMTIGEDFYGKEENPEDIDVHGFTDILKEYAQQLIEDTSIEGLARDYAYSFLSCVNYYEIAKHMIDAAIEEQKYQMVSDASRSYGPQAHERV
jgi:hypothetical protein